MKKWDRLKQIRSNPELSSNEKLVAVMIVSHWNQDYNQARLKRQTLMDDTGLSKNPLTYAIRSLCEDDKIFQRVQTGRSNIYRPGRIFSDYGNKGIGIVGVRKCETPDVFGLETSDSVKSKSSGGKIFPPLRPEDNLKITRTSHLIGRWDEGRLLREAKASDWTNDDVN